MRIVQRDEFIRYLQKNPVWLTRYNYTRSIMEYVDKAGVVLGTGRYSNSGGEPEYMLIDVELYRVKAAKIEAAAPQPTAKKKPGGKK